MDSWLDSADGRTPTLLVTMQDAQDTLPLELTPKAIAMAKQKLAAVGPDAVGLRLGVRGGGCSGYNYVIDYAKKVRDGKDEVFEVEGLR
ncbi:MAG: iron-sulfur cluster biosynthesis family protein, partial [Polyangiales bacterium]